MPSLLAINMMLQDAIQALFHIRINYSITVLRKLHTNRIIEQRIEHLLASRSLWCFIKRTEEILTVFTDDPGLKVLATNFVGRTSNEEVREQNTTSREKEEREWSLSRTDGHHPPYWQKEGREGSSRVLVVGDLLIVELICHRPRSRRDQTMHTQMWMPRRPEKTQKIWWKSKNPSHPKKWKLNTFK